ncbi:MAG: oxidoreductase [Formivibrio sp.]|nr:oxidoreductase [Formivibrio sp.]
MMNLLWRLFRRDLHARAWRTLLFAVTIAIASLTAVGLLASRMERLLAVETNSLLAADAVIVADHPVPEMYTRMATAHGLQQAALTTFPSMARKGDLTALASIKAASPAYPLRGELKFAPAGAVGTVPARGEMVTDARLAALLDAKPGDVVQVGNLGLKLVAILTREPDGAIDFSGTQPRLLINAADLPASGLIGFGSRARYRLLVAGTPQQVAAWIAEVKPKLGRGERLEDAREARPEINTALTRAERFLRLSALVAGCLAAVAMLLAARRYASRRFDEVAILRALGATRKRIAGLLFGQLMLLVALASALGGLLGWGSEAALIALMRSRLPPVIPDPDWRAWVLAAVLGSALLLGGAGPMLHALSRTSPLRVLRRELAPPASVWMLWCALALATAGLLWLLAGEIKLALYAGGGMLGALLLAGGIGLVVLLLIRRFMPGGTPGLAARQILRRRGLAFAQLGALAAGLLGVWLLTVVEGDLLHAWQDRLGGDVPNHFAINIQPDQQAKLAVLFAGQGLAVPVLQPMIRGRWVQHNGQPVEPAQYADERARRLAEREFNLSWGAALRKDNRLVAGVPLVDDKPGFSVEEGLAKTLGIHLGDRLTFDIAGTQVVAPVVNLRAVEWDSFRVNFFVTANAALLREMPTSLITSFNLPPEQGKLITGLVRALPNVTVIDVGQILAEVQRVLDLASAALRLVFFFCIAAGVAVLWAALDATESERSREAAVMRALGASARRLRRVWLTESLLLGGVAGLVAGMVASLTGWLVGQEVLQLAIGFNLWLPLLSCSVGALISALAALRRLSRLANTPPVVLLRDEG